MSDDHVDEVMAELIGNGFFDLVMTPDGDVLYKISENAETIAPDLYAMLMSSITDELMEFIQLGYLEYRLTDDLDLEYRFTDAGIEYMEQHGYKFDDD
jgi:hypothetical protein